MTPPSDTPLDTPTGYTLKEAAERVGVSVSTLRRRRDLLKKAGAQQIEGRWCIPQEALDAVFNPSPDTPLDAPPDAPRDTPSDTLLIDHLLNENAWLRGQVADLTAALREQSQAQAVIEAQRAGLAIEATDPEPKPRRRWWHRGR